MSYERSGGYNVVVFDDSWRSMKASLAYMEAFSRSMGSYRREPDTEETLREAYATGGISFGEFSARLDVVLRG